MKPESLEKIPVMPEQSGPERTKEGSWEKPLEKKAEKKEVKKEKESISFDPVNQNSQVVSDYRQRRLKAIDDILAEGMDEAFLKMTPQEQKRFKAEGEKTAAKINQLLDKAKGSLNKVVALIKRWLRIIPHVNRFFLEQEAKLKADKILRIKDEL